MTTYVSPEAEAAWNAHLAEAKAGIAASAYPVISRDTKLVSCGRNTCKGLSPFRKEKTPSLFRECPVRC